MIEYVLAAVTEQLREFWAFLSTTYEPVRDTIEILVVAVVIYWLLLLIRGTRAVQILAGLMALLALRLVSDFFDLQTLSWILDNFLSSFVFIIIILFADDIRRGLARVGRGFVPRLAEKQETQILEEVVRACQVLSQRRVRRAGRPRARNAPRRPDRGGHAPRCRRVEGAADLDLPADVAAA